LLVTTKPLFHPELAVVLDELTVAILTTPPETTSEELLVKPAAAPVPTQALLVITPIIVVFPVPLKVKLVVPLYMVALAEPASFTPKLLKQRLERFWLKPRDEDE